MRDKPGESRSTSRAVTVGASRTVARPARADVKNFMMAGCRRAGGCILRNKVREVDVELSVRASNKKSYSRVVNILIRIKRRKGRKAKLNVWRDRKSDWDERVTVMSWTST